MNLSNDSIALSEPAAQVSGANGMNGHKPQTPKTDKRRKQSLGPDEVSANVADLKIAGEGSRTNDTANGHWFLSQYGTKVRYVKKWKSWLVWDGTCWQRDERDDVMELAKTAAKGIYDAAWDAPSDERKKLAAWAIKTADIYRLEAMLKAAQSDPRVARIPDDFDKDHHLLNVRNGTIDLRTGELRPHNPNDHIMQYVDIDYDPDATCPLWHSYLDSIMLDRKHMVDFLQRAVGYSLTGGVKEECMFVLHGGGSNGKSTLIETLQLLVAGYGQTMEPETLTATHHQRSGAQASPDIARLKGARLVTVNEAQQGKRLDESLVKRKIYEQETYLNRIAAKAECR